MMPMWGGYWGHPWGGFGWFFPLIGLFFMALIVVMCFRMMGRRMGDGCMAGHDAHSSPELEDLRREVRELREEIRKLRERG